ncbi:hypothetical protein DFH07DRAFT_770460 [Mycena maculata]|uniref:CFEM domain-containing protein n=1 Tax=Mycena maculata TaxID=230809 RepID=A0AAD7NKC3_9AGAR|nr:hypothetical protein DFH07DRAFT_770460 [Mycena maculata]
MRFSAALAVSALFAAFVSASTLPLHRRQFPNCASNCLANPDLGGCTAGDDTCLCNNDVFVSSTFSCIEAACTGDDLEQAIAGAASLCAAVHVTLVSAAGAEFSATASLASSPAATSSTVALTAATDTPAAASDAATPSSASTTTAATTNSNGALSPSANTALLALGAIGALAFAL